MSKQERATRKAQKKASEAPSTPLQEGTKRKRQLVSTACLCCQTKHRACGIERPCFQCVRFGIECVEGEERSKIRKKRTKKPKPEVVASPPYSPAQDQASSSQASDSSPPTSPPPTPIITPNSISSPPSYGPYHTYAHSQSPNQQPGIFQEFPSGSVTTGQPQQTVTLSYVEDLLFNPNNGSTFTSDLLSSFNSDLPAESHYYAHPHLPTATSPLGVQSHPIPFFSAPVYSSSNQFVPTTIPTHNGLASPFLQSHARSPIFSYVPPSLYNHLSSSQNFNPATVETDDTVKRLLDEVTVLKHQLAGCENSDDTVKALTEEVSSLKQQLSTKQPTERPVLVSSMANSVWKLPDGPLMDNNKNMYILLKVPRNKLSLDDPPAKDQIEDLQSLRKRLVQDRAPTMNRTGYKTLQCSNGNVVTMMSCSLLVHFDDQAALQNSASLWNAAN